MLSVREIVNRRRFFLTVDRIGPDIPATHWRLHFKSTNLELCKKKFKHFGFGSEFRPGAYANTCSKISIGANVVIRPGTFLFADPNIGGGEITIEDDVLMGPNVQCFTTNHEFLNPNEPIISQGYSNHSKENSILIRRGSWIGASAILLAGVEIGENAVVGAGSIVTKSVPPKVVVAGNPAKIIRELF